MKQWRKYLVAAGSAFAVLALVLVINNNSSKENAAASPGTTEIKANLQTGENETNIKEADTLLSAKINTAEVNTAEQDTATVENQSVSEEDIESEIKKLIHTYYEIPSKSDKNNENTSEQTAETPKVDDKKIEIIEKYKNIKTYIKPGLEKDSYVVFTTYDIKLYNVDTLVPGMSSLSVTRDDSGSLQINDGSYDKKLKDYIIKLSKEKDIKKLISNVNSKLKKAVDKDHSLKELIDYLK